MRILLAVRTSLAILLALFQVGSTVNLSSSWRIRGGSSRLENWQRKEKRKTVKLDATTTDDSSPISKLSSGRRACGFYVWDAPSALLYRWCNYLLKDCVYEGRGGRKFVRIEPGSILQLLYPCSRYSPDRCIICGGTFADHLTLWWSKNLYTPFDRALDKVSKEGTLLPPSPEEQLARAKKDRSYYPTSKPEYVFHKRYVLDVSSLIKGVTSERQEKRLLQRAVQQDPSLSGHGAIDKRRIGELNVSYLVPAVKVKPRPSATFGFIRAMFLNAVEALMYLEATENGILENSS